MEADYIIAVEILHGPDAGRIVYLAVRDGQADYIFNPLAADRFTGEQAARQLACMGFNASIVKWSV